jgi:hypothetical protein
MNNNQLEQHQKELASRVACHEIGHLSVACALGFETGRVTLELLPNHGHRGSAGITLVRKVTSLSDCDRYLCERMKILFAGAMAETLKRGQEFKGVNEDEANSILTSADGGANQDWSRIREHQQLLRNLRNPDIDPADEDRRRDELQAICDECLAETLAIVNHNAHPIVSLATALAAKVTGLNVEVCLEKSDYKPSWFCLPDAELSGETSK